jgi:hypothetical protein
MTSVEATLRGAREQALPVIALTPPGNFPAFKTIERGLASKEWPPFANRGRAP